MSYLTPSNVLLFLLAIVGLIGVGFGTRAVILNHHSPFTADNPDEEYPEDDDEEYPEDDDDDYDDDDYDDDEAPGEITLMSRVDWIERRDFMRMKFRAENPRLFSDTWYEDSRKEFSQWAANVYRENSLAA